MKDYELWQLYPDREGKVYASWAFGGAPDEMARLVVLKKKKATSSLYLLYDLENETLPKAGSYSIVLDSKGDAQCIIKTTKVRIIPFDLVTSADACLEGEDDMTLEKWRKKHREFFFKEARAYNIHFDESMEIVFEEFVLEFVPPKKN